MSTRDYAVDVFNSLNESQLLDFLKLFADDNTLALLESEIIASGAKRNHYSSFKELLQEIEEEEDDE